MIPLPSALLQLVGVSRQEVPGQMPADLLDKVNESDPPPKKRGPRAGDWDPAGNPPGWDGKPEERLALTVYPDRMWTSSTRPDRIVESLQMLQSQGLTAPLPEGRGFPRLHGNFEDSWLTLPHS